MENPQQVPSNLAAEKSPTAPSMALQPFQLSELDASATPEAVVGNLADVELDLRVELGATQLSLAQIMKLRRGSVVPLDVAISEPVRLFADEQLIAMGEVMVLNDQFCIRITKLIQGQDQEGAEASSQDLSTDMEVEDAA
ncbi:MAG: FliM/FliN family flagellar motor C-terminal domain-containing protein [Planctomycetota bacterium]